MIITLRSYYAKSSKSPLDFSDDIQELKEKIEVKFQLFCLKLMEPAKEKGIYYLEALNSHLRAQQIRAQQNVATESLQSSASNLFLQAQKSLPYGGLSSCMQGVLR